MIEIQADSVGGRLLLARRAAKLTQSALARAAEIPSESAISKYERGESEPELATLRRLADALGITVGWLANGEGDPPVDTSASDSTAAA